MSIFGFYVFRRASLNALTRHNYDAGYKDAITHATRTLLRVSKHLSGERASAVLNAAEEVAALECHVKGNL